MTPRKVAPPPEQQPCDYFSRDTGVCGEAGARRYMPGWRCAKHTPAALAGQPEPGGEQ